MSQGRQYHTTGPNQGFAPVQTAEAVQPKWKVEVGPVGYGSPVIGLDGTIFIGTLRGELVAITPEGTIKWRQVLISRENPDYPGPIIGSPAVGSDGNIYVITTTNLNIRDHRNGNIQIKRVRHSNLHSVDPAGNIRWTFRFPVNTSAGGIGAYTNSSPKVWGDPPLIFVPAVYQTAGLAVELLVISQSGDLLHKSDVASYPPEPIVGEGPGFVDILDAIWDFISSPVDFDTSGIGHSLEQQFGWPEPSIAIVDYPSFANNPFIVIEDNYKTLSAFRWQSPILVPLWRNASDKGRLRTSPAVFPGNLIAIGDNNKTMNFYDLESGNELWKPWFKGDKPIMSPPASFGRQVYFTADKKLIVLDSNSKLWQQATLGSKCLGSVTLSANFAYVNANDGLYTFSFDLQNFSKNSNVVGGVSSPVISDEGTVYVMDLRKTLWAFGGRIRKTKVRDHRSATNRDPR